MFTSPAHRSPVTMRTPVSPREMSEETNEFQLVESSCQSLGHADHLPVPVITSGFLRSFEVVGA